MDTRCFELSRQAGVPNVVNVAAGSKDLSPLPAGCHSRVANKTFSGATSSAVAREGEFNESSNARMLSSPKTPEGKRSI